MGLITYWKDSLVALAIGGTTTDEDVKQQYDIHDMEYIFDNIHCLKIA